MLSGYGRSDLAFAQEVVDCIPPRLLGVAARIERGVRDGDPSFFVHDAEGHAAGYRSAAKFVLSVRDHVLERYDVELSRR